MNRTSSGAAMHGPGQPRCVRSGAQPDAVAWRRAILGPTPSAVEAKMENWFIMSPSPTTTSRRVANRASSNRVSVGRTARRQAAVFGQRLSAVEARMESGVIMPILDSNKQTSYEANRQRRGDERPKTGRLRACGGRAQRRRATN